MKSKTKQNPTTPKLILCYETGYSYIGGEISSEKLDSLISYTAWMKAKMVCSGKRCHTKTLLCQLCRFNPIVFKMGENEKNPVFMCYVV